MKEFRLDREGPYSRVDNRVGPYLRSWLRRDWLNRAFIYSNIRISIFTEPIRRSPFFISPMDQSRFYASIGQSIKIECKAVGFGLQLNFQLLQVKKADSNNGSWSLNVVKKPTQFQITESARGSRKTHTAIIQFDDISKKDFGQYTCMVGNSIGYSTTSFIIKKKPSTRNPVKQQPGTSNLD